MEPKSISNSSKINAKSRIEKDSEQNRTFMFFWCVKQCKLIHCKNIVFLRFSRLRVWVDEWKGIKQTNNMWPNSIPKSMQSQCEICAGRSDGKMIQKGRQTGTQVDTIVRKQIHANQCEKNRVRPDMPRESAARAGAPSKNNSSRFRLVFVTFPSCHLLVFV